MIKLFVGNLQTSTTEATLHALFQSYGRVRSLELVKDIFTGNCKGSAFLEMEGHEARAAIDALNGKTFEGKPLKVQYESSRRKSGRGGRR